MAVDVFIFVWIVKLAFAHLKNVVRRQYGYVLTDEEGNTRLAWLRISQSERVYCRCHIINGITAPSWGRFVSHLVHSIYMPLWISLLSFMKIELLHWQIFTADICLTVGEHKNEWQTKECFSDCVNQVWLCLDLHRCIPNDVRIVLKIWTVRKKRRKKNDQIQ